MNPLVPLLCLLSLPILAICAVLYTDAGIEPALFYSAVKTFAVLFAVGGLLAFVASRLAERSQGTRP